MRSCGLDPLDFESLDSQESFESACSLKPEFELLPQCGQSKDTSAQCFLPQVSHRLSHWFSLCSVCGSLSWSLCQHAQK